MEIRQLRHFLALYDKRHFGRAAEQLELSQSALTKSIRKLETDLGVRLFERGRYGAVPTLFGDALVQRAKAILSEETLVQQELTDLQTAGHGLVRVGISYSCAHRIMPQAIARLNRSHPQLTVIVFEGSSDSLLNQLLSGQFDFVLASPPLGFYHDPELRIEKMYRDRDLIVASQDNPMTGQREVSITDLSRSRWAISNKHNDSFRHIQKLFAAEGLQGPRISVRTDSTSLTLSLIRRAGHVSLLSEDFIASANNLSGMKAIRNREFERTRIGYLFSRKRSRLTSAAEVLADHTREVCLDLHGSGNAFK